MSHWSRATRGNVTDCGGRADCAACWRAGCFCAVVWLDERRGGGAVSRRRHSLWGLMEGPVYSDSVESLETDVSLRSAS